jgi:hypothetical protein
VADVEPPPVLAEGGSSLVLAARRPGRRGGDDSRYCRRSPRLGEVLRTAVLHIALQHRIGTPLIEQTLIDPGHRVSLLTRSFQIRVQDLINRRLERIQLRRSRGVVLATPRPGRPQRLSHHRTPMTCSAVRCDAVRD